MFLMLELRTQTSRNREGPGVKLGEILPWVTMGGGRGEGQVGQSAHNDQDSAILVSVIFGGASNY